MHAILEENDTYVVRDGEVRTIVGYIKLDPSTKNYSLLDSNKQRLPLGWPEAVPTIGQGIDVLEYFMAYK
jgi:hypothetical protein